jgi:hypothetical protein
MITKKKDWVAAIPAALFTMRTAKNRATQTTPFKLTYGVDARLPLDCNWCEEDEQQNVSKANEDSSSIQLASFVMRASNLPVTLHFGVHCLGI